MPDASASQSRSLSAKVYGIGLVCLLLSIGASLILAGDYLSVLEAPGCGGDSACNQAAASAWGKLPLLGWPLSLFGLAWFSALAAGWTVAFFGAGPSRLLRLAVRLGSAGSVVYVGAMVAGGYLCPYCLLVHTGALAFLVVMERTARAAGSTAEVGGSALQASWIAATFVFITGLELSADAVANRQQEAARAESTQAIMAASLKGSDPSSQPFTGRYRIGPEQAPIRVVIFSDYQCPFCGMLEKQARELVEERSDMSLSAKHYPLCTDCNKHTQNNMHPKSCEAARAAEAAGMLGGADAFWATHRWLFELEGSFSQEQLQQHLFEIGLNEEDFLAALHGDASLDRVEQDVEEAHSLGMYGTPMVFIKWVELKGIGAKGALRRAVEELAAMGLTAHDPNVDRPASASQKHITDWRANPLRNLDGGRKTWTIGSEDAPVEIVVWGDYLTDLTTEADKLVRSIIERRDDVRYVFHHFPINTVCNPISQRTLVAESCLAHGAAQAAGALDGNAGYWRMHEWLLSHQAGFTREVLAAAAQGLGFEPVALLARLDDPEVAKQIALDCGLAARMGVTSVPFVFINGRKVPAWSQAGMLEVLVEAAAAESPQAKPTARVADPTPAPDPSALPPTRQGMDAAALRAELNRKLKRSGGAAARARLAREALNDPNKAAELEKLLDEQGATPSEREALYRTMERLRTTIRQRANPSPSASSRADD